MNTNTKFMFDREFETAATEAKAKSSPVKEVPVYSEEDIARIKADAFAEGSSLGRSQALEEAEGALAGTMEVLNTNLQQLLGTQASVLHAAKKEAATLALTAAGKIAPALIRKSPHAEVIQMIEDCLIDLQDEPRIVVRASEPTCDALKTRVDEMSMKAGFQGNVILLPDDELGAGDCRIEWADGGVERNLEKIRQKLDLVINKFVQSDAETSI
jgi:flagellar assembly protein FliH